MDDRALRATIGLSASAFNQLAQNKVISSIRVRVEHAIGGITRMRITTDKFRNKSNMYIPQNFPCVYLSPI
jgi:hypothetical protein